MNQIPIGFVVGEARSDSFLFVTTPDLCPPRLEYVVLKGLRERISGKEEGVEVLAQITELRATSQVFDSALTFQETETILRAEYSASPRILATATVLGYLDSQDRVFLPRSTPLPGDRVFVAPDDLLERFFTRNIQDGILVGTLINRPQVKVKIDPNGLRRHLAIIAQTGAGKSYLSGILLENLLQLGGTIIVFDPNSDYVYMRKDRRGKETPFSGDILVYRVPNIKGRRFSDEEIGGSNSYTIQFSRLGIDEICTLGGIPESYSNIREAIKKACAELEEDNIDYKPPELAKKLKEMAGILEDEYLSLHTQRFLEGKEEPIPELTPKGGKRKGLSPDIEKGAERAIKYIENLCSYDIWGFSDVPIEELLKPVRLSVIDLAGLERSVTEFVVDKTLREIWARATTGKLPYPVFVVLEEAHTFVPQENKSHCREIINRIASEGRKFKVFLIVITQRPHKIHQDTLSQCASQIIMKLTNPEDQEAVKKAAENLSSDLFADLPGLNVGEAILLGTLTRVPVMIKAGERITREGGSDIDVPEALKLALREKKMKVPPEFLERVEPEEAG
ncbi:MAG: ATP-binding protein [Caldiserica bacterium]|jgi:DNA helicase HerA-like ATPase|nr:ATP-binding protein [Caldisericota bacterium]MDH7561775.1 ATP-binding protein [Caldisericota bacterium]